MMMNRGHIQPNRPSLGSWLAYGLGSESDNLPGFVAMSPRAQPRGKLANWGSSFLPGAYAGSYVNIGSMKPDAVVADLKNGSLNRSEQRKQADLLTKLNREFLARRKKDAHGASAHGGRRPSAPSAQTSAATASTTASTTTASTICAKSASAVVAAATCISGFDMHRRCPPAVWRAAMGAPTAPVASGKLSFGLSSHEINTRVRVVCQRRLDAQPRCVRLADPGGSDPGGLGGRRWLGGRRELVRVQRHDRARGASPRRRSGRG